MVPVPSVPGFPVVLKEKPAVAENGFIPLGALRTNGKGTSAAKPEVAEPVAGD
jgi:hypothetical protein